MPARLLISLQRKYGINAYSLDKSNAIIRHVPRQITVAPLALEMAVSFVESEMWRTSTAPKMSCIAATTNRTLSAG